ncbi:hypothetical protein FLGE108171_06770 [Flavobacterium gelidilacus]|uniref:hypothetical protein n=1 Tax=Flavobacterium gelidilacus TaxID=206041 RepID=UPI00047A4890|nr:hypothetical protein [Flavobacterium gelidilacus]
MNFILRDNKNKVYQSFWGESKENEQRIAQNTKTIYLKTKQHLIINYVTPNFDIEEHLGTGWKNDQELYNRLIDHYNSLEYENLKP